MAVLMVYPEGHGAGDESEVRFARDESATDRASAARRLSGERLGRGEARS